MTRTMNKPIFNMKNTERKKKNRIHTVVSREVETTVFDPASVFLSTH